MHPKGSYALDLVPRRQHSWDLVNHQEVGLLGRGGGWWYPWKNILGPWFLPHSFLLLAVTRTALPHNVYATVIFFFDLTFGSTRWNQWSLTEEFESVSQNKTFFFKKVFLDNFSQKINPSCLSGFHHLLFGPWYKLLAFRLHAKFCLLPDVSF